MKVSGSGSGSGCHTPSPLVTTRARWSGHGPAHGLRSRLRLPAAGWLEPSPAAEACLTGTRAHRPCTVQRRAGQGRGSHRCRRLRPPGCARAQPPGQTAAGLARAAAVEAPPPARADRGGQKRAAGRDGQGGQRTGVGAGGEQTGMGAGRQRKGWEKRGSRQGREKGAGRQGRGGPGSIEEAPHRYIQRRW